ncbi:class F sortase [Lentibacillus sp. N15]|uniref:class F sortase n=1 Tax=Lentibacillus songyuanensis TaxID=3136161 RepID=UPI0031B9F94D
MWKFASLLLLILLIGCGQTQSTDSAESQLKSATESKPPTHETNSPSSQDKQNDSDTKKKDSKPATPFESEKDYRIKPSKIKIDSIDVESAVDDVGLMKNGEMAVPDDFRITGWYDRGTMPGEQGSSVIAGHVDDKTGPGIFFNLKDLNKGDEVEVMDEDGKKLVFEVVDKQSFPMDDAPVKKIFGYTSRRMLNLVTCTGPFDRSKGGHIDRLVVYTELKTDK